MEKKICFANSITLSQSIHNSVLTEIISQGISCGEITFEYPEALAEIVLIVIAVKLDNYILPSTTEDIDKTLKGLILLLEKGTGLPDGTIEYLSIQNN